MTEVLILLGAPGAGKGTQAKRLARALDLPHISTGDLFRANLSEGTELGQRARGFMEKGQLVPDDLVLDMLFDRVAADDCQRGYLLDGFPRTEPQAAALSERLSGDSNGGAIKVSAINIDVDSDELIGRLTGRLTCSQCGNIHHRRFSPPAVEGVCDNCSGSLEQRKDDAEEVVRNRLAVYQEQTLPLVGYYQEQGLLASIDGNQSPEEVFYSLMRSLGKDV